MRDTYPHKTFVVGCIVNAIRNSHSIRLAGVIALQNMQRSTTIGASWIFKVSNQFALFGVYRNRRKTGFFVLFSLAYQITHLAVAAGVFPFILSLAVGSENIAAFLQQTTNGIRSNFIALTLEFSANRVRSFLGPLQACDRIVSRFIFQQFVQCIYDPRLFFSTR